jgi:hypothetical protein
MTDRDSEQEDPRLRLVWEEARRGVELQVAQLDETRGRAVALITLSGAAAAITSASLKKGETPHGAALVTFAAFTLILLLGAFALAPRRGWRFFRRADHLLSGYIDHEQPAGINEMYRNLAKHLLDDFQDNDTRLRWIYMGLRVACGLLVIQVLAAAWTLAR